MSSLAAQTIKNIGYRGFARGVTFALQAVTSIILAQHLTPKDFGIINFAMIFVAFITRFNELGIGSALIQDKNLDERAINTAFSIRLILGGMAFLSALGVSFLAAVSFGDPAVGGVIRILSFNFLISSIGFIPHILMIKALDFRRWVWPFMGAAVVRTLVACTLAIQGFGYWSVVIAEVSSTSIQAILYRIVGKRRERPTWDKEKAKELLKYGLPLFSSGLVTFALFNADNFIIGSVAGAAILGYYALAFNWGSMISGLVGEVVHSVLFPTFAKLQDQPGKLATAYHKVMGQLSVIGILGYVVLFACAERFLVLVLGRGGDKWLPSCNALRILCLYGIVRLLLEPVGNVYLALAHTKLLFRANLIAAACQIALVYPAIKFGTIELVSIVVTACYALQWFVYWPSMRKILGLSLKGMTRLLLPSIAAGIATAGLGLYLDSVLPKGFGGVALLVIATGLCFLALQGLLSSWSWLKECHQLLAARFKGA